MNIINKIKFLFSKPSFEEKKKEVIKLEDSIDFLKSHSDESKFLEKLKNLEEKIKQKTKEIEELLKSLDKAEIPRNIHETPAVENKVLSNRAAYIGAANILLKKLESRDDFEVSFNEFSEKSVKPYYTTQYLFGKELKVVASEIQELSKLYVEKKSLNKEISESKFKKIEKKILLLRDTLRNKKTIKQELEIIEREIKIGDMVSLERKYVGLKNSQGYQDVLKKREDCSSLVHRLREEIITIFSDIKRILKKANNKKKSWLVQYYIDEPIDALAEDSELKIINFISEINPEDASGESLGPLKNITEEKLRILRSHYKNAVDNLKEAEKKENVEQELTNLENKMFHLKSQKDILSKKLEELKARDLVNPEELKKEIENNLTEISGILVEVGL